MRSAGFDRDEVLEKITDAFWENGYEATSIGVLESATGLKRQSLYNAFGNKDAMFESALNAYQQRVNARLLQTLENPDPRAALHDFFARQATILLDAGQPSGCLVSGAQQELANRGETLGENMRSLLLGQHSTLVEVFERWQDAGKLTSDANPAALAAIVMGALRGQAVLARAACSRDLVASAAETLPEMFERYLV